MQSFKKRSEMLNRISLVAIPVLALITLFGWAWSSAPGSSPDDDFHLASIWCGLGDRDGMCEPTDAGAESIERLVPTPISSATCSATDRDASAACWKGNADGLAPMPRANIDKLYPPLFYATMSIFAGPDVGASVILMRLMNSVLTVALLSAVFLFLPRRLRPALVLSVVASSVPLGLFVFASTNPSSWALLSAAVVWVAVYGATTASSRAQSVVLTSLAVLAGVMGAGARADAALFAVFGTLIGLWLGFRSIRAHLVPLGGAAVIVVASVALYFSAAQSSAATEGLSGYGALSMSQLLRNALELPSLWIGAFGYWPLGWFDTGMPTSVWTLAFAVFGFVLLSGVRGASIRRIVAYSGALFAMWFVPLFMLAQSGANVGEGVQPRYILPLMIIALGVAAVEENPRQVWRGWPLTISAVLLAGANAIALHVNLRRYTTGLDVNTIDPGARAEWWWAWAPSPLTVWIAGAGAFALLLAALLLVNRQRLTISGSVLPPSTTALHDDEPRREDESAGHAIPTPSPKNSEQSLA